MREISAVAYRTEKCLDCGCMDGIHVVVTSRRSRQESGCAIVRGEAHEYVILSCCMCTDRNSTALCNTLIAFHAPLL